MAGPAADRAGKEGSAPQGVRLLQKAAQSSPLCPVQTQSPTKTTRSRSLVCSHAPAGFGRDFRNRRGQMTRPLVPASTRPTSENEVILQMRERYTAVSSDRSLVARNFLVNRRCKHWFCGALDRAVQVEFFQLFNMGYQNYSQGEWQVARRMLSDTQS